MKPKKLVLKNGMEFVGYGEGSEKIAEVIFNTSMIGYQDILKNPYYTGKIVCMTYPLMGNYGASDDDFGHREYRVSGFVVKDDSFVQANFRYLDTMKDVLDANDVSMLCGIDTRMLCKVIRNEGSMLGIITDIEVSKIEALEKINNYVAPKLLVNKLTTKRMNAIKANKPKYHIACLDLGYKQNVVNVLTSKKCNVTMLPYNVDAAKILATNANALVITDGPDNPADLNVVVETVKSLIGKLPIVGIGLGHLIVACACGAEVVKMKYGHHGANQSVKCLKNNKILITNQAHQYEVSKESLENTILKPTYINLSDGSIEGLESKENLVVTTQLDFNNVSGPSNIKTIYDELISLMKSNNGGKNCA